MNTLEKWAIPLVALACAVILGGSYFASVAIKQSSIERMNAEKIAIEKFESKVARLEEIDRQENLDNCLALAEEAYYSYARLNGTVKKDGSIWALDEVWDTATKQKNSSKDVCFKKYKK